MNIFEAVSQITEEQRKLVRSSNDLSDKELLERFSIYLQTTESGLTRMYHNFSDMQLIRLERLLPKVISEYFED